VPAPPAAAAPPPPLLPAPVAVLRLAHVPPGLCGLLLLLQGPARCCWLPSKRTAGCCQ
jgi:hypothetical protein